MTQIILIEKEELQALIRKEVEAAVTTVLNVESKQSQKRNAASVYMNRMDAALMLRISLSTLGRLVKQGHLKCRKVGRKSLFLLSDLEKVVLTLNQ